MKRHLEKVALAARCAGFDVFSSAAEIKAKGAACQARVRCSVAEVAASVTSERE